MESLIDAAKRGDVRLLLRGRRIPPVHAGRIPLSNSLKRV